MKISIWRKRWDENASVRVAVGCVRDASAASEAICTTNSFVQFLNRYDRFHRETVEAELRTSSSTSSAISILSQINWAIRSPFLTIRENGKIDRLTKSSRSYWWIRNRCGWREPRQHFPDNLHRSHQLEGRFNGGWKGFCPSLPPVSIPNLAARPERGAKWSAVRNRKRHQDCSRTYAAVTSEGHGDLDIRLSDHSSSSW